MQVLPLFLCLVTDIFLESNAFIIPAVRSKALPLSGISNPSILLCKDTLSTTSSSEILNILDHGGRIFKSLKSKLGYHSKRSVRTRPVPGTKTGFRGIVEEIGVVSEISAELLVPGVTLTIDCFDVLCNAYEGCSLAVNGVAVPVTKCGRRFLQV